MIEWEVKLPARQLSLRFVGPALNDRLRLIQPGIEARIHRRIEGKAADVVGLGISWEQALISPDESLAVTINEDLAALLSILDFFDESDPEESGPWLAVTAERIPGMALVAAVTAALIAKQIGTFVRDESELIRLGREAAPDQFFRLLEGHAGRGLVRTQRDLMGW